MKALFRILIVVVTLTSCTPQDRLNRLIRKHPELVKRDTVWTKDTVVVNGTSADTSFYFYQKDTVVIKKDQLTLKYFFNKDSTIYISGKCDTITVIKEVPTYINSVTSKYTGRDIKLIIIVLAVLAILYLLFRRI